MTAEQILRDLIGAGADPELADDGGIAVLA